MTARRYTQTQPSGNLGAGSGPFPCAANPLIQPMMFDEPVPGIPGAIIRRVAELPDALADAKPAGRYAEGKPGELLFQVPGAGRFRITAGELIEYCVEQDADEGELRLYLYGTARGALIHQRGELPLHAATMVVPGSDDAFAICGASGAGKSTLAAALSRRGWKLVADDTTRITCEQDGPLAWPSRDTIKLWRDACGRVGISVDSLDAVARNLDKYYWPVPAVDRAVPLAFIVEIAGDRLESDLTVGEKMALVSRNTYRSGHIPVLGMQRQHVAMVAKTAQSCRIFRLPGDKSESAEALADRVEKMVASTVPC